MCKNSIKVNRKLFEFRRKIYISFTRHFLYMLLFVQQTSSGQFSESSNCSSNSPASYLPCGMNRYRYCQFRAEWYHRPSSAGFVKSKLKNSSACRYVSAVVGSNLWRQLWLFVCKMPAGRWHGQPTTVVLGDCHRRSSVWSLSRTSEASNVSPRVLLPVQSLWDNFRTTRAIVSRRGTWSDWSGGLCWELAALREMSQRATQQQWLRGNKGARPKKGPPPFGL